MAIYQVGLYAEGVILGWFKVLYLEYSDLKLDMGKCKAEDLVWNLCRRS